jgi:hypothetical protein
MQCSPRWGTQPSADLKLPPELADPGQTKQRVADAGATGGSAGPVDTGKGLGGPVRDSWYGFYPNGREVVFAVEGSHGEDVNAIYAIGPSIDGESPAAWTRRTGHLADDGFVFEQNGKSTLRFRMRADGGLTATWISIDGKTSMTAHLRHVDPQALAQLPATHASISTPVTTTAANGDSDQTEN